MSRTTIPPHVAQGASRREFLRQAGAMTALAGGGAPLALNLAALGSAAAQSASDYKAIVCLFLLGGNDAYNTVLATDAASFAHYTAVRSQAPDSIALLAPGTPRAGTGASPAALGGVLPISPRRAQGRAFALHPLLGPLQTMFDVDKRLAIVPNVGTLVMPTTKAQYALASHPRPKNLFSHNDQQNVWQSFQPEGATEGWGGRMGDLLASANAHPVFTAVTVGGNAVWLAGRDTRQYQVSAAGAIRMGTNAAGQLYGSAAVGAAMERIVRATRGGHLLEADLAAVSARSIQAESRLRGALAARPPSDARFGTPSAAYNAANDPKLQYTHPVSGVPAFNALAQQLQMVARLVDAAGEAEVGARRQVFFVSMSGFDNHDAQNANHAQLMARLSHAMRYFDDTLGAIGARHKVTLFTASDFGRTFTSNGDGTDHGWGAHHFVMGGAVRGGDLYGSFPLYAAKNTANNGFDGSPDQLSNGSLLPATSVDQLGATLGRWFGLSDTQLLDVFPHLANWNAAQRDLGFMI